MSAPKFASFRPKPKPPQPPLPEEPRRQEKEEITRREKGHTSKREKENTSQRDEKPPDSHSKPYFSDRRGDLDILKYGTPNLYHVPSYRRTGYGHVLGLPDQKIDREHSTDKKIYMTSLVRQRQKRMLTDKHAAKENRRPVRLVKVAESHQPDAARDFIALSSTKRKRSSSSDIDEAPEIDYRGIDGKPDSDKLNDPDTYFESDTEAFNANSEITIKHSRLIRETRDDPANLQAWLDLVEHQEAMLKLDRATTELSPADRQNLADVRISTYEEALRKVGAHESSQVELQAGMLREAQRHWDDAKVATRWQDALKKHPRSAMLWFGYLDFAQSTCSTFKYEECRLAFSKALDALKSTDTTITMHLFVRLAAMTQQAGYQELALAAWQALLEYNTLAPPDLTTDKAQRFEDFWESEAPRIGEQDSKGWRHTVVDDAVPPTCRISLDPSDSTSSIGGFIHRETECITKLRYPGRSTDDVAEEDPFHTIFFSDLKDLVVRTPHATLEMYLDAFLCFCRLPRLAGYHKGPWWDDPFLQSSDAIHPIERECEPQFSDALSQYSSSPFARFQMTSELLVSQTFSLESSRLSAEFVTNVLQLLATSSPDSESVGEYLLAFQCKHNPSAVTKTAKRLLRARPTSVRLYNMYGLAENHLSNNAKAQQVFEAALGIKTTSADQLQLLSSYVWQALHSGDEAGALQRLPASSVLQQTLETALLAQDLPTAILGTSLLALHSYLTCFGNPAAALSINANLTSWLVSHKLSSSTHAELHAQSIAQLLAHHATHHATKPSLIRNALNPLIATFPHNTMLLSTYTANESRFAIDDRVRGNTTQVLRLSPAASTSTWAFAIAHESLRTAVAGRTSHSIRALYKRATHVDAAGSHCPALWSMYLAFEMEELERSRSHGKGMGKGWERRFAEAKDRVKQTIYTGLRHLPWDKDFLLLSLRLTLPMDIFTDEELNRLLHIMPEKELRLYTELN